MTIGSTGFYKGITFRLTVQITNNGYKNLTLIPKSINEIEKIMNSSKNIYTRQKKTKKKNYTH